MVASVDGLLEKLLGQYQVLAYLIVVSNVVHVHLNHYLLQHNLWTPPHHCKVPKEWDETQALPIFSRSTRDDLAIKSSRHDAQNYNDVEHQFPSNHNTETYASKHVLEKRQAEESLQKPIILQNQTILVLYDFKNSKLKASEDRSSHKQLSSQSRSTDEGDLHTKLLGTPESITFSHSKGSNIEYSSCEMYIVPNQPAKGTEPCTNGYVFILEKTEWTITAEWGLVCDRGWIHHWLRVSYSVGLVIGGILFGLLSDRFGRRTLLLICVGVVGSLGLTLHFVKRLIVYVVIRCIQAIFAQGLHLISWTLIAEMLPPKWRCRGLVAAGIASPLGAILAAVASIHLGHWRAIQLASSLPVIASLCYSCLIPESLRWLLTRGKVIKAHKEANRSARLNLLLLPPTAYSHLKSLSTTLTQEVALAPMVSPTFNPTVLITSPRIRRNLFIVSILWFAITVTEKVLKGEVAPFGTDGIIVRKKGEGILFLKMKNPLLESMVVAGVDAGGVMVAVILSSLLYRRSLLIMLMLLAAGMTLVFVGTLRVVSNSWKSIPVIWIIMKLVGVLVLASSRALAGVILPEVSPTTARATAIGLCMAVSGVGQILTPLLILLGDLTTDIVPWLICTALCLFSALILLLLPETSGINLPDVVEEAEIVGLRHRGDFIKSSKDPGYGRTGHPIDIEGLTLQQSDAHYVSRIIDLTSPPISGSHSLSPDPRYSTTFTKMARNACAANLRNLTASFPIIKQNKFLNKGMPKPFFYNNSTSSFSLYSSTSFADMIQDSCSTCANKSLSKNESSEFLRSCSNLSAEVTSTDILSVENDTESNVAAEINAERHSKKFNESHDKYKMFDRIDQTIKEESEVEQEDFQVANGKFNIINVVNNKGNHKWDGDKLIHLKASLGISNNDAQTICNEEFQNDNEISSKTTMPKVVSGIPKLKRPRQRYVAKEIKDDDIEICSLQMKHAKRPTSPTEIKKLKTNTSVAKNDEVPNQNSKSISLSSMLIAQSECENKSIGQKLTSATSKREIPKQYIKKTLTRQTSSTEPSKSRRMDDRLKTQSFMLPRKSYIGKEVALKIAKFEKSESTVKFSNKNNQSKIPIPSPSRVKSSQASNETKRNENPTASISEKKKHFASHNSQITVNRKSKNRIRNSGTYKITKETNKEKPNFNQAYQDEFFIPQSDIEITDEELV